MSRAWLGGDFCWRHEGLAGWEQSRDSVAIGGSQIPHLHVVFGESALKRQVGGPDIMRRQLITLVEA